MAALAPLLARLRQLGETWLLPLWDGLLDLAYPQDCFFCGRPANPPGTPRRDRGYICLDCLQHIGIARHPTCRICGLEAPTPYESPFLCPNCLLRHPAYEQAFIAARYEGAIRDLIQTFKYHRGLWLQNDFGRYLEALYVAHLKPLALTFDAIVPVPMLRAKLHSRGYNQALLLAQALSKRIHLPCKSRLLERIDTGILSQTRLHRRERLRNAAAAYRLCGTPDLAGQRLILVDDVMTTGATCNICAGLLKQAGAEAVYVLAIARPYAEC